MTTCRGSNWLSNSLFSTRFLVLIPKSKQNPTISNKTTYKVDENNSFSFTTRRNKEISLTEYYDFSYEYKNDCLTAGIKYNKTFYQDSDLVPEENLFLTVSFIPLTKYERSIYQKTN